MSIGNFFQFPHAKSGGYHRQYFGMPARSLSLALVALCATASCFTPEYHCRITCPENGPACPTHFTCDRKTNLCASDEMGATCETSVQLPPPGPDGGIDVPSPDVSTADAIGDVPAPIDAGDPPAQLCHGTNCFDLSPETRKVLVLWLDPSNLPTMIGTTVGRWPDRSGRRNDALALSPESLPRSSGNGLSLHQGPAGAMRLLQDPSLDFGTTDFTLMMVASVSKSPSCFYANFDGKNRADPRGVEMRWGYSTPLSETTLEATINRTRLDSNRRGLGDQRPHLFVLRRSGAMAELRLDGGVIAYTPLESPDVNTTTVTPIYLGGCSDSGWPLPVIHAAVAGRRGICTDGSVQAGTVPDSELRPPTLKSRPEALLEFQGQGMRASDSGRRRRRHPRPSRCWRRKKGSAPQMLPVQAQA